MGTNFYIRGHRRDDSPEFHLGKRSAAGLYCWDCKETLCLDGTSGVHESKSGWATMCLTCGQKPNIESIGASTAGRELGFNQDTPRRKSGVSSCSSFRWAMEEKDMIGKIAEIEKCPNCDHPYPDTDKVIEDEYGSPYTLAQFRQILQECPIQYQDSIGQVFC